MIEENARHRRKMLSIEEKCPTEKTGSTEKKYDPQRRKSARQERKRLGRTKNAQQRRQKLNTEEKKARQSNNMHIRGALHLWPTVLLNN